MNTNIIPNIAKGKISISSFITNTGTNIPFFVYLPPLWNPELDYSLVLFMHGQGGDETTFKKYVDSTQLNAWIENGEIPDVVIAGISGGDDKDNMQWYSDRNQKLLVPDLGGEFIEFCKLNFKAGGKKCISIEGHSRGREIAFNSQRVFPYIYRQVQLLISSYF